MVDFFKAKYSKEDIWHILRSMVYFEDAENQIKDPESLKKVKWKDVKTKVKLAVKNYVDEQSNG